MKYFLGLVLLIGCGRSGGCLISPPGHLPIYACRETDHALGILSYEYQRIGLSRLDGAVVVLHFGDCVSVTGSGGESHWSDGFCSYGTDDDCNLNVAWPGEHVSDTVLAHEAMHCSLERTTGDPDSNHSGPFWDMADHEMPAMLRAVGL